MATTNAEATGNAVTAGEDYSAVSTINFKVPARQISVRFSVKLFGDRIVDRNEILRVMNRNVNGANAMLDRAVGRITNDDLTDSR